MVVLLTIRSTIQPAFIFFSASCAGVAAAAGEVAKDWKLWRRLDLLSSGVFWSVDSFCLENVKSYC